MNPFDLPGPAFLVLYLIASLAALLLLLLVVLGILQGPQRDASPMARRLLRDPYLVSYLRGGQRELLHTLLFALHERKLLTRVGEYFITTGLTSPEAVTHPLEVTLLRQCSARLTMKDLLQDPLLRLAAEEYTAPLRTEGLMADDAEYVRRRPALVLIAGSLAALSVTKIVIAVQRGHTNIAFLVMLTLAALAAAYAIYRLPRTSEGRRALHDQQTLFARLKDRVGRMSATGATNEAVLVAATFGLAALPRVVYPSAARISKQKLRENLACSSACGSSCGGGGCGGGCGGCGS